MEKSFSQDIQNINHFSEMLLRIENEQGLDTVLTILMSKLKIVNLKEIHPLVLNCLINNCCAKILILYSSINEPQTFVDFIDFAFQNNLIPPVYVPSIKMINFEILKNSPQSKLSLKNTVSSEDNTNEFSNQIHNILNSLLNIEFKPEKTMNKNVGYALLELNGDFVWCDPNCEKYFEIKGKELGSKNFFDMIIPLSKNSLSKKFGPSLFCQVNYIGAEIAFSFVIYSKNSMNKFLKCLKKIGILSELDFRERLKKKDSEDAIFHQYLKALSTKARMILLNYTQPELEGVLNNKKNTINCTRSFFDFGSEKGGSKKRGSLSEGGDKKSSLTVIGSDDPNDVGLAQGNKNSHMKIRQLILLETRLALNVPNFDYRQMNEDLKIKSLEQKIIKKITKAT